MPDPPEIGKTRDAIIRNAPIAAAIALSLFIALYAGDYLLLRARIAVRGTDAATSTVTIYYAALLKNGKFSVFYDQPETQISVRSIFPWLGYQPSRPRPGFALDRWSSISSIERQSVATGRSICGRVNSSCSNT